MIVKVAEHGAYATLHCPPAGNEMFRHTSAVWDQDRRAWLVMSVDVEALTQWLRQRGHVVVTDVAVARTHVPPVTQLRLGEYQDPDVARRGAAECRAAMRNARPSTDDASTMHP